MERYVDLVRAYLLDGEEAYLASIGSLRDFFVTHDVPIEELVGLHERALSNVKDLLSIAGCSDVVLKTSACLTELLLAYSSAGHKMRDLREGELQMQREGQRLEALGQMVGGVAHEFNNLLQPIMGMAELALEDAEEKSELAEQLSAILDCADQAAVIVRGILVTARPQGPKPEWRPFAPLLKKTVHFVGAIIPPDVTLDLAIACNDERVLCDPGELSQVIMNLVRNAADAMNGKGTIRIVLQSWVEDKTVRETVPATHLRLIVADDGHGMSPEVAIRAFQPFFTTKQPTQGTGLGLSVVRAIVNGWGAEIEIDSAPGEGTRISIILPIGPIVG